MFSSSVLRVYAQQESFVLCRENSNIFLRKSLTFCGRNSPPFANTCDCDWRFPRKVGERGITTKKRRIFPPLNRFSSRRSPPDSRFAHIRYKNGGTPPTPGRRRISSQQPHSIPMHTSRQCSPPSRLARVLPERGVRRHVRSTVRAREQIDRRVLSRNERGGIIRPGNHYILCLLIFSSRSETRRKETSVSLSLCVCVCLLARRKRRSRALSFSLILRFSKAETTALSLSLSAINYHFAMLTL